MNEKIKKLTGAQIKKMLQTLPDWSLNQKETEISASFPIHSFISGLGFIAKITVHAEILNHHPAIEFTYGKVKVKLTTHETKSLTKLDFELARRISSIILR